MIPRQKQKMEKENVSTVVSMDVVVDVMRAYFKRGICENRNRHCHSCDNDIKFCKLTFECRRYFLWSSACEQRENDFKKWNKNYEFLSSRSQDILEPF